MFGRIGGVFDNFLANYLDVPMPDFNSGVFEDIEFEAIPEKKWFGKFPSIFGLYRPYSAGDDTSFTLKIKRKGETCFSLKLILRLGDTDKKIRTFNCTKEGSEIFIEGVSLPSEISYLLKPVSREDKSVAIVSIIPFNNDQMGMMILSAIITFLCTVFSVLLAWILGVIEVNTEWILNLF